MSEIGTKAARDMSKLEVPTVDDAIHLGEHVKENGQAMNGSANGGVSARGTRTKRA